MSRERNLRLAEEFVRSQVEKRNPNLSEEKIREIAAKVAKALPPFK